jgi:hypothetical protein
MSSSILLFLFSAAQIVPAGVEVDETSEGGKNVADRNE